MCIRDHNAWLASNWFPIPGAGLDRPRGTRVRIRSTLHAGGIIFVLQLLGSKLNRTTGSVKSTTFHEERCIIASPRPRGDFDACIGELVARLLSFACPLTRDLLDGVFIERLYQTYVPSIRSLFFFFFSLGKGLDYDQRGFLFFFFIPSR